MNEPTNTELLDAIQAQRGEFKEHTSEDHDFQDKTMLVHAAQAESGAEMEAKLASLEDKIDGLATKEDLDKQTESIKEAVLLSNRIKVGEAGLKYLIEKAPNLAALGMIILCIWLFVKFGLLGAIASVTGIKL